MSSRTTANKKRDRLVFQAVEDLDEEDKIGLTKRLASSKKQKQNSRAAISQQSVFTKLLEVRILLQRALQAEHNDNDAAIVQCNDLLAGLLSARDSMLREDNDEDIDQKKDYAALVQNDDALEERLGQDYAALEKGWKTVLNRRHKDVRLHAGLTSKSQFRVLDSSFWEQVDQTVTHEKLMLKKTSSDNDNTKKASLLMGFDDSKVYQQHLKEFLSSSSSLSNAGSAQSTRPSNVERLSGSRRTVNHVDRRASKGRKIRYNPIPKLVNFTFPLSRPNTASMLDEDAWFRSLFGGAGVSSGSSSTMPQGGEA